MAFELRLTQSTHSSALFFAELGRGRRSFPQFPRAFLCVKGLSSPMSPRGDLPFFDGQRKTFVIAPFLIHPEQSVRNSLRPESQPRNQPTGDLVVRVT